MKAIRIHQFGGPDVLKFETVADLKPATGQVIVRVKAAGVNPVDAYIRSGNYGSRNFPFTPGLDAAGVIESVGVGVSALKSGDRVYVFGGGSGTYADQVLLDASAVRPLPDKISFGAGAALGVPYVTAYLALVARGQARSGEWVLIHGASGGVGVAAVQIARSLGLNVIGTAGTPEGRQLVTREGAHHVLDHTSTGYLDQAVKLTGNKGLDLIIEMLANVNLANDLKVLAPRGRVIVVGNRGKIEIDPRDLMGRWADVRGMSLMTALPEEVVRAHSAIGAGLGNGTLRPVIKEELPLAEAAKAQEHIMASGAHGKIVLVP